jgi:hypothetical protein
VRRQLADERLQPEGEILNYLIVVELEVAVLLPQLLCLRLLCTIRPNAHGGAGVLGLLGGLLRPKRLLVLLWHKS